MCGLLMQQVPRLFDEDAAKSAAKFDALITKYRAVKPGLMYVTYSLPVNMSAVHHQLL